MHVVNKQCIDTELVYNVILRLRRSQAADVAGLTAKHLIYSHPSIAVVLSKLFQLIMLYGHVPSGFRHSYIVPVPKIKDCRTKSIACDDFSCIAISPILFKVFELSRIPLLAARSDNGYQVGTVQQSVSDKDLGS